MWYTRVYETRAFYKTDKLQSIPLMTKKKVEEIKKIFPLNTTSTVIVCFCQKPEDFNIRISETVLYIHQYIYIFIYKVLFVHNNNFMSTCVYKKTV